LDSKKKDRSGSKCPGCHRSFAFDPNAGDLVSDAAFKAAIDAVSSGGTLRWGVEHLFYELNRRRRSKVKPAGCLFVVAVFLTFFLFVALSGGTGFFVPAAVCVVVLCFLIYERLRGLPFGFSMTVKIPLSKFNAMWDKWLSVHGKPEGVISRKPVSKPRAGKAESDLADYSFDRAVICDRARTVDLLLANNFHFENNCAVLSIEGYPEGPFETVRAMLQRNPRLQIFALHDATATGCRLAFRLAHDRKWFPGRVVVDVGLRPGHAPPLRGLMLPAPELVVAGEIVSGEEAAWLSQYVLELAAIRPEQILKRLYRAINGAAEAEAVDLAADSSGTGGSVEYDSDSFSADAGDGEGAADGFG
jgi:hypothetical protein